MKALLVVGALLALDAQATTIYLCEYYSGGSFFSNGPCSQQKATAREFFNVPSHLSFDQQVAIVNQQIAQRNVASGQQQAKSQSSGNAKKCAALHEERLGIEAYDTKMQWRPIEEINKAQYRMRGLRAEMARLGCPLQ